jgi:hypothetical protein
LSFLINFKQSYFLKSIFQILIAKRDPSVYFGFEMSDFGFGVIAQNKSGGQYDRRSMDTSKILVV